MKALVTLQTWQGAYPSIPISTIPLFVVTATPVFLTSWNGDSTRSFGTTVDNTRMADYD